MPHPLDSVCLGHYRRRGRARGALVLRDPVEGLHAPLNDLVHPRPIGQVLLQAKPAQVNNRGVVANTFFIFFFFFSGKRVQRSDFGRMGGEGRRANGSPRLTLIRPLDLSRDHRERKATPRLAQNVLKWALPEAHVVQQAAQGPNVRALVEDALARAVEELRGPIRARGVGLRLLLREE